MAQIYGELIRAQLQVSASDLTPTATGLVYFNSSTGLKWHTGSGWKTAVDLDSTQSLSGKTLDSSCIIDAGSLSIVPLEKGGLGLDATTITGLVRISSPGGVSAGQITVDDIPDLTVLYSKLDLADGDIPQAKVTDLVDDLGNKVEANAAITGATKTKITYDAKGLVTAGDDLISDDIPATLLEKVISSTSEITGALILPVGTTGEQPSPATQGMVRYNTTDATFEGYNGTAWGAIGGGGGGTIDTITQASHGFVVGDVLYLNGSTYAKAKADAANTAEVVGVVSSVLSSSQFQLTLSGEVSGLTGLVAGEVYFLSADTAGALTVTEPTVVGQVSLPVGVASSTTSLYVAPKRGSVVGSSNARTQIALANNATTTVQNISAYDAGELTGWISITATTPLRFYVAAQFSKNGAANNYNLSYQVSGDTPPTGFSVTATAAGLLQVTLPSITGFASASINYALNAPAIGTTFPLSVSASSITGGIFSEGNFTASLVTRAGSAELGLNRSSDGTAYIDLISQASELDFNARIIRGSGVNGNLEFINAGNGYLALNANGLDRLRLGSGGIETRNVAGITYVGLGGIGTANAIGFKWNSPNLIARIDNSVDVTLANVSDYRIKRDVETQEVAALERISQLRPVTYKMADYGELFKQSEDVHEGFLAHEIQSVIPSAVIGEKDSPDQIQSLNLGALCSVMVKAIQELKTELDSVKSELEALKNK